MTNIVEQKNQYSHTLTDCLEATDS